MRHLTLLATATLVGITFLLFPQQANLPRGIRNNNPGNIKRTTDQWEGMSDVQTDPVFVQFDSPVWGFRAMMRILRSYERRGITTIQDIISTYAPPTENNTAAYIDFVASRLGVPSHTTMNLDLDALPLIRAMTLFENKPFENFYNDETIQRGINLA